MPTDASWEAWSSASVAGNVPTLASMGAAPAPLLQESMALNAPFSQQQWEVAQQEGCPGQTYPTWPPSSAGAYTYPTLQALEEVSGTDGGTYGTPYAPSAQEVGAMKISACIAPQDAAFGAGAELQDCGLTVPNNPAGVEVLPQIAQLPVVQNAMADLDDAANAPASAVPSLMVNTVQGVAYDMSHWSNLPRESAWEKLKFVFGRDGRPRYLLLWGLLLVLVLLIAAMM